VTSLNVARLQVNSAGLTTATTAYTALDTLGTIITATMATATGIIQSVQLVDKANIVGGVNIFVFDRSVTLAADNAAWSVTDADMLFCLGVISMPAGFSSTLNLTAHVDSLAIPYVANASSQIFLGLQTLAAHTFFGAAGDLVTSLNYIKDV
jgi:hypothetical protein